MNNPFESIDARLSNIESLLIDIKHGNLPSLENEPNKFITVPEAAKFLSLSIPTIYSLISKAQLPVIKKSKRCYFSTTDLEDYLKSGRRHSRAEIENNAQLFIRRKGGSQ